MSEVHSFPPVADADATCLILGTMPGVASLAAGRYYAHPRNGFWSLIEHVLALPPGLDYDARCAALRTHRIALWDVLKHCERSGSLDSSIARQSMVANDFPGFLQEHGPILCIFFNGQSAAAFWRKLVAPTLPPSLVPLTVVLPSSSPAHAGMPLAEKRLRWHKLLQGNRFQ